MQLTPPKIVTFWIAVALAVAGGIVILFNMNYTNYALLLLTAAFILLMLGNLLKGL